MHWCPVHGWESGSSTNAVHFVAARDNFARVAGPNPPPTFSPVEITTVTRPPPKDMISTMPEAQPPVARWTAPARMAPVQAMSPTRHGPPAWYLAATHVLDTAMSYAVGATGKKGVASEEDVFYLDRLIEALRIWDKKLLTHANILRGALPKKTYFP